MQTTIHTFSFRFFWGHLCQPPSTELIQINLDSSFLLLIMLKHIQKIGSNRSVPSAHRPSVQIRCVPIFIRSLLWIYLLPNKRLVFRFKFVWLCFYIYTCLLCLLSNNSCLQVFNRSMTPFFVFFSIIKRWRK